MKTKITNILLISTLLLSVGCSNNNNNNNNNISESKTKTYTVVFNEDIQELYTIHETTFEKVKELYNQYGFEAEEYNYINNQYYYGNQGIEYKNIENLNHGDIYNAIYEISIDDNNNPTEVYANLFMKIDPEEIKTNGFKMEGTFFEAMDKIMIGKNIDYSEVNQEIINAYTNNAGLLDSTKEYDNVSCRISTDGSMLVYTITISSNK